MTRFVPPALLAVGLAALVGCGSSGPTIGTSDMWARPTAPDAANAAFYGTVTNNGEVTMEFEDGYSRSCDRIELHQSEVEDGVVTMGPAEGALRVVEPGESMVLEPMGLHLMCLGVSEPFVEGTTVDLELTFDGAGAVEFDVEVEQS